ncbi:hypothetical protein JXB31_03940 [Candidatus Woesearchaeota archaeon]|nr:hypothetical protein [Candidatus Woesearchaeota archaeon]
MSQELSEYIKKERKKGFSDKKIRLALIKAGNPEADVDGSFEELSNDGKEGQGPEEGQENGDGQSKAALGSTAKGLMDEHQKIKRAFAILSVAIFLLLIAGTYFIITNSHGPGKSDGLEPSDQDTGKDSGDDVQYILDENHNKVAVKGAGCDYPTKVKSMVCNGIKNKEFDRCMLIEDETVKAECEMTIRFVWAVREEDPNICNDAYYAVCKAAISGDQNTCNSLDGKDATDDCNAALNLARGIRESDQSVCDNEKNDPYGEDVLSQNFKDICIMMTSNDPGLCDKYYDMRCPQ